MGQKSPWVELRGCGDETKHAPDCILENIWKYIPVFLGDLTETQPPSLNYQKQSADSDCFTL